MPYKCSKHRGSSMRAFPYIRLWALSKQLFFSVLSLPTPHKAWELEAVPCPSAQAKKRGCSHIWLLIKICSHLLKGVRKDLSMILDEFLHPPHPQKAMKEYGVTPYPATPHQLLQSAGIGEASPGWPNQNSWQVSSGENTLRAPKKKIYGSPIWDLCFAHEIAFDIILVYSPRHWSGVLRKALFLWLCLPHHNQDNKYRHIDVFCVMWAPEKLVWILFFLFCSLPRNHKR